MRRLGVVFGTTALLGLIGAASTQPTSTPAGAYATHETHVGPLDAEMLFPVFSGDGQHFAYVTHKGPKSCVVVDGQAGAEYDKVAEAALIFSPDSKRVVYAAKTGAKWSVVVDGQVGARV